MLLLIASPAVAQEVDEPEPLDLATVNAGSLTVLARAEVDADALQSVQTELGQVFAKPERLSVVPGRSEVARYWQAHGLVALHRGSDPASALRLACLLDTTPVTDVAVEGFYEAFSEACALPPPALVPLDLGELAGTWAVWIDGEPHGVGQFVRSGQHLVQVTEDGALVSSRWVKASADAPPPPPPPPPPEDPLDNACSGRCRAVRVGAVGALVLGAGLTTWAVYEGVVEERLDDEADEWGISTEDTLRRVRAVSRRNAAGAGAGVAVGLGVSGLVVSGRF